MVAMMRLLTQDVWVIANFKKQVNKIIGQNVKVTLSYSSYELNEGLSLSPASASFSLIPPQMYSKLY